MVRLPGFSPSGDDNENCPFGLSNCSESYPGREDPMLGRESFSEEVRWELKSFNFSNKNHMTYPPTQNPIHQDPLVLISY